jgi:hypothetical protein
MDLNQFLSWLSNSGGSIIVVSWILEQFDWWQVQTAKAKKFMFFGFCLLVSVLAYVGLNYIPADILKFMEPYFLMAYAVFGTVFIGESFHKINKN